MRDEEAPKITYHQVENVSDEEINKVYDLIFEEVIRLNNLENKEQDSQE